MLIKVPLHPAMQYAHDVRDGKIVAGRLLKLAVERNFHDLEHKDERGLYFDEEMADRRCRWFERCKQYDGEFEGIPLGPLPPWQQWITWVTYGWKRKKDGTRRFRQRWIEVGSGNGKTTFGAADCLGMQIADGEAGAEVYAVATHRDQAYIPWHAAYCMVEQSPDLREILDYFDSFNNKRIVFPARKAVFLPLGRDTATSSSEGKKPHALLFDEIHEYKDRKQVDILLKKMVKRRQPLATFITTASDGTPETLYEEMHDYAVAIVEGFKGSFIDDSFFAVTFSIDEEDEPFAEDTTQDQMLEMVKKANPNLGISVNTDSIIEHWRKGQKISHEQSTFLRYSCDRTASTTVREISSEEWDACKAKDPIDWNTFADVPCIGAFDLSSTRDLTAITLLYWKEVRPWYRFFAFLPRELLKKKCDDDRVPYDQWAKDGWLELTPGNRIDDEYIARRIIELNEENSIVQWTCDMARAQFVANVVHREGGIEVVSFIQDLIRFAEPVMHFLDEMRALEMQHDGNPLARWCATNVVTKEDAMGLRQFHKRASKKRIDPIVAAAMARGRAIVNDLKNYQPTIEWDGKIETWS